MKDYPIVTWYDTPRAIAAFVEAEHDRRKWWRGDAVPEPETPEPATLEDTRPIERPARR